MYNILSFKKIITQKSKSYKNNIDIYKDYQKIIKTEFSDDKEYEKYEKLQNVFAPILTTHTDIYKHKITPIFFNSTLDIFIYITLLKSKLKNLVTFVNNTNIPEEYIKFNYYEKIYQDNKDNIAKYKDNIYDTLLIELKEPLKGTSKTPNKFGVSSENKILNNKIINEISKLKKNIILITDIFNIINIFDSLINFTFYEEGEIYIVGDKVIISLYYNKVNKAVNNITYDDYNNFAIKTFADYINNINLLKNIKISYNNSEYINNLKKSNRLYCINFLKKNNIIVYDWINVHSNKFYDELININYANFPLNYNLQLSKKIKEIKDVKDIKIDIYNDVKINYMEKFRNLLVMLDSAYFMASSLENIDKDKNKNKNKNGEKKRFAREIYNFFNHNYKKMNKDLIEKKGVSINNLHVSRAWVKMQELLHETNFFDNFKNNKVIKGFHTCEAPGNFIKSIEFYLNNRMKIEKYDWISQSLYDNNIDDQYKLIENNKERWDFGVLNGDISKYENLIYYYKKYKNSDIYVSDCGLDWWQGKSETFIIYQLIYSLVIPKVGGNFIIKMQSYNLDKKFVSLLYLLYIYYEKVYIYKSNLNFWSSELYMVGINKKEMNEKDTNTILNYFNNIDEHYNYLINYVPGEFCINLEYILNKYVTSFLKIRKLFDFFVVNKKLFNDNKEHILNIIYKKNDEWIKRYID
jgi:hypothetical protein